MKIHHQLVKQLALYLIETPFNPFANRADPDQGTLFVYGNMTLSDPTLYTSGPDN